MHWTSILTALALALSAAYLVLIGNWAPFEAFGAVGAFALVLVVSLTGGLLLMSPKHQRRAVLNEIVATIRNDLRQLLSTFRRRD